MKDYRSAIWMFVVLGLLASGRADAQWTQFRGPNGSGVDSAAGYPVEFSPAKNVAWQAAVPFGQSSPVIAGGHVYLTAGDGNKLLTICLNARTGRELWRRQGPRPRTAKKDSANDT